MNKLEKMQHHIELLERELNKKESEHKQTVVALVIVLICVTGTAAFIWWNMRQDVVRLEDKRLCAVEYVKKEGLTMCRHQAESEVEQAAIDAGLAN